MLTGANRLTIINSPYWFTQNTLLTDPLTEIISILRPQAPFSKLVHASSPFRIRRDNVNDVFYCLLLSGEAYLEVSGKQPQYLKSGDFLVIPALSTFSFSSLPIPSSTVINTPIQGVDGIYRIGGSTDADVKVIVGNCSFASSNADLLISLMPDLIVVSGERRLATFASLLQEEISNARPARDGIVEHLLQVLLIEAFRSHHNISSSPGLLKGLVDPRIGPVIRAIHSDPSHSWTIPELAKIAVLSRSALFTRFNSIVGMSPIEYLTNWRMTKAKQLLDSGHTSIAKIAEDIGYGSSSAFSTAFTREVGIPPGEYAKKR